MKQRFSALALALCLLVGAMPLSGCSPTQRYSVTWWDVFDTVTVVTAYAPGEDAFNSQMDALHEDLVRYDHLFDIYNQYDGLVNLATVNSQAGQGPVAVEQPILDLLGLGEKAYDVSHGKCNIAAGAVLQLWHDAREAGLASPETAALPDADALAAASAHCNIADMQLNQTEGTVTLADPAMRLDVGSIGKGYAVELAACAAQARGLTSALLNVGGNLRAIGTKGNGAAWTAGIENPWLDANGNQNAGSYLATLDLQAGESLVTSGDYQRYYTVDGVRYAHLIDPDTLQPARYFSSVAVLCAEGGAADALSTALFCMPRADGQAMLDSLPGTQAVWLAPDGTITMTPGFESRCQLVK